VMYVVVGSWWLLLAAGCGPSAHPTASLTLGEHTVQAEVVSTNKARQRGLMERESMPEDHGMLFVYPDTKVRGFWMKDTWIPLSIAFADSDGTIVRIADMQPHDLSRTSSLYPAMYALEMNQGWFEAHDVSKGDTIGGIPEVDAE